MRFQYLSQLRLSVWRIVIVLVLGLLLTSMTALLVTPQSASRPVGTPASLTDQENTPPVADFTVEPPSGVVGTVFTFDPAGSHDAESTLAWLSARFDWDNDGAFDTAWLNASQPTEQTFFSAGIYSVTMLIQDPGGLSDTTTRVLDVGSPGTNTPPTARCVVTPVTGTLDSVFTFDAGTSSDDHDAPAALLARWDLHDSGHWHTPWVPITQTQQQQFNRVGLHTVRLRVRDGGTLSHDTTCTVLVEAPNTEPIARFTVTPAWGNTATVFTFDSSTSHDAEESLDWLSVRYDWDNDGLYDTAWWNASQTTTNVFGRWGSRTVRMIVKDTGGLTDATTRTVNVVGVAYLPLLLDGRR